RCSPARTPPLLRRVVRPPGRAPLPPTPNLPLRSAAETASTTAPRELAPRRQRGKPRRESWRRDAGPRHPHRGHYYTHARCRGISACASRSRQRTVFPATSALGRLVSRRGTDSMIRPRFSYEGSGRGAFVLALVAFASAGASCT